MESYHDRSLISTLKVDFHCSKDCPVIVKKRLQQLNGVESISFDAKQGMVTVIGKVNPMKLVKLIQKMGQRAELWSFQKAPMQAESNSPTKQNVHDSHRNLNSHCCCYHDSNGDESSDSDDNDCKMANSPIYRQDPQFKGTYSEKSKKENGWKNWMGFGNYFVEPIRVWIKSPRRPKKFPAPTYSPLMCFHRHRCLQIQCHLMVTNAQFLNMVVNFGAEISTTIATQTVIAMPYIHNSTCTLCYTITLGCCFLWLQN